MEAVHRQHDGDARAVALDRRFDKRRRQRALAGARWSDDADDHPAGGRRRRQQLVDASVERLPVHRPIVPRRNGSGGAIVAIAMMTTIDVRPAAARDHTQIDWLDCRHSFSFGRHYDPANTHHGLLLVSNDDRVRAGTGFGTHPHRDMEIVTWVLDGELEHDDSERQPRRSSTPAWPSG